MKVDVPGNGMDHPVGVHKWRYSQPTSQAALEPATPDDEYIAVHFLLSIVTGWSISVKTGLTNNPRFRQKNLQSSCALPQINAHIFAHGV